MQTPRENVGGFDGIAPRGAVIYDGNMHSLNGGLRIAEGIWNSRWMRAAVWVFAGESFLPLPHAYQKGAGNM